MSTMLDRKTSWQDRLAYQWGVLKPFALVLVLGLVAGPLISNYMGWQVTSGAANRENSAVAIRQQAMVCDAMARGDTPNASTLDWGARRSLAEKFAVMPGRQEAESGVAMACSEMLAKP
jgi:hypothetical protein